MQTVVAALFEISLADADSYCSVTNSNTLPGAHWPITSITTVPNLTLWGFSHTRTTATRLRHTHASSILKTMARWRESCVNG